MYYPRKLFKRVVAQLFFEKSIFKKVQILVVNICRNAVINFKIKKNLEKKIFVKKFFRKKKFEKNV